jgi:hypothetical protein
MTEVFVPLDSGATSSANARKLALCAAEDGPGRESFDARQTKRPSRTEPSTRRPVGLGLLDDLRRPLDRPACPGVEFPGHIKSHRAFFESSHHLPESGVNCWRPARWVTHSLQQL